MKGAAFFICVLLVLSCAVQKQVVNRSPLTEFIADSSMTLAHVGVTVYDPAAKKYIYDYQGNKYFIPASNTKILTCYAAMKYLKHILSGMNYYENDTAVYLIPTGDPTLLHPDFVNQPVIKFLQQQKKKLYITDLIFKDTELGRGWCWDDYNDDYMTERNALPVYGNTIKWIQQKITSNDAGPEQSVSVYSDPEVNWKLRFVGDAGKKVFHVQRDRLNNIFYVAEGNEAHAEQQVPFIVNGIQSALELLADTVGSPVVITDHFRFNNPRLRQIWTQPLDSVLKPMMYRSDNFFAEQLLLMVSAELTGVMNDELVIDTLLKTDLADLRQKPVWVDGSGLSRYNSFSPQLIIEVLDKMKNEFGMERIKNLFPSGDSGTLKGFYKNQTPYLYAKTGSMTGVIALSGFLYTKDNRLLEFSVLVNNYKAGATAVRKRIEQFIQEIR